MFGETSVLTWGWRGHRGIGGPQPMPAGLLHHAVHAAVAGTFDYRPFVLTWSWDELG
jgi:hypothetical protein